jgi:hypothetical protein
MKHDDCASDTQTVILKRQAPSNAKWPLCDWCGVRATHIHVHKIVGDQCAHFACDVHAKEDDGNHVVHAIANVTVEKPG